MTEEQNLVYTRGLLLQAEIELQGMIAANEQRKLAGESPAYGEQAFLDIIDRHQVHHNGLVTNLTGY